MINLKWLFFLFDPTSHEHQFYGVVSGFTMLFMKTKYDCHGLPRQRVNFHNNRLVGTVILRVKIRR